MELPISIKEKIDTLLDGYKLSSLKKVSFSMMDLYKKEEKVSVIDSELKAKVYASTRMPATFKVVDEVFNQIDLPRDSIKSSLDVGAGLGAASLAIRYHFDLAKLDLYEKEIAMMDLGKTILEDNKYNYKEFDLVKDDINDIHDLVITSYVLNEIKEDIRKEVITKLFNATNDVLVIIEPGTPAGFKIIKEARDLLKDKANILAPCPHNGICPMKDNDWCHFSTRVQRSKLHKQLKEAEVPYEDEKYSYIVFSKKQTANYNSRILRHPLIYKGMVKLLTCSNEGIKEVEIRKNHPNYKMIKKLKVGDSF